MPTNRGPVLLPRLVVVVVLIAVGSCLADKDLCSSRCKDAPLPLPNKDIDPEGKYVTTCCQRGCRFFNLADLHRGIEPKSLNNSLEACDSSCTEAYSVIQDIIACRIGCVFKANQRANGLVSPFSIAILNIDDGIGPNILLMSPDIPENDILTDPVLGKEMIPGWWDANGFKLPETFLKTIPVDSGSLDYSISSEYLGENGKSASLPGSDWLQCASRHTGIPRWLLAFSIATAALSALWLCLSPEKPTDPVDKITLVRPSVPTKVTVYLPDEAPLHKKPPPKYYDVVDTNDPNLQV